MSMDWPLRYSAKDGRRIIIRHAAYGDAPALHAGLLEVAREGTHVRIEPEGVGDLPAEIERLRRYLTTPRMARLVAELDGQVVGAVSLKPGPFGRKDRHWCSLEVWLASASRGNGIGRALMRAALAWAESEGFQKIVAEVFGSNEWAIALYRESGFGPEGRQKKMFLLPGIGYVDKVLIGLELGNGSQASL